MIFVIYLLFFKINIVEKQSGKQHKSVNSLDQDQAYRLSGLILVQTVRESFQQTALARKGFIYSQILRFLIFVFTG